LPATSVVAPSVYSSTTSLLDGLKIPNTRNLDCVGVRVWINGHTNHATGKLTQDTYSFGLNA